MWLQIRTGPDAGEAVELPADRPFVVGRQRGSDLVVRDTQASRRHAELTSDARGGVLLRDLGSANGTLVDGGRVQEVRLQGGEEVRIGDVVIAVTTGPPSHSPPPLPGAGAATATATPSMVRRLVEHSARGTRRAAQAAVAVAVLAVAAVAVLVLGRGRDDVPGVVERVSASTVLVVAERGGLRTGNGSGWVLDADAGLIVTNAHVVNQGEAFRVARAGRSTPARVVAVAPCEDVALLRVQDARGLRTATLAPGESIERGETVVALGYAADAAPGDAVGSTTGVVSVAATSLRDPAPDVPAYPAVLQTDTALNPGGSGGPLADLQGRVVGMDAAARTTGADGRPLQGVNYAIRIDRARRVLTDLQAGRAAGWTGFTFAYPTDRELRDARLPPGLRITGAIPGTPAAAAGVEPGALLAGIDGTPVANTLASYCRAIGGRRTGDDVVLSFARPGEARTRQVRLRLA